MSTVILDCRGTDGREDAVAQAADVIRAGRLLVLPTDTVYGVAADAFDRVAVAMVLAAKHRSREMPPPVLVPSPRTVDGLATDVPLYAQILMRAFWPGPLTVVLKAQSSLSWDLGHTNGTVALRMPQDPVALSVLSEVGPMAVTSANVTGQPAATTAAQACEQLGGAVSLYLDDGPREERGASTIVDCTGSEPVVLRHGSVPAQALREVLGDTPVHDEPPREAPTGSESADPSASMPTTISGGPRMVGSLRPSGVLPAQAARKDVAPTPPHQFDQTPTVGH